MSLAAAYSASAPAWRDGPARVYGRLAELLVDHVPGGVAGRRVLDLGSGTGVASTVARAAGAAAVVAADLAVGMLALGPRPACAADAVALPFAPGAFDVVVAAFSLNHLSDPVPGLREAARVLGPGGGLVVSAYAADDTHPVKAAVEDVLRARGWAPEPWHEAIRRHAVPKLATVERAAAAMAAAGLGGGVVAAVREPFPHLSPAELVTWRLGMAQAAPFVHRLDPEERTAVAAEAEARLGPRPPVLVRSIVVATWRREPPPPTPSSVQRHRTTPTPGRQHPPGPPGPPGRAGRPSAGAGQPSTTPAAVRSELA